MQTGPLGFDANKTGGLLRYRGKNGFTPAPGVSAQALMLPSHVNVFVTINSSANAYAGSLRSIISNAYEGAVR